MVKPHFKTDFDDYWPEPRDPPPEPPTQQVPPDPPTWPSPIDPSVPDMGLN